MPLSIDAVIFVGFLLINLVFGLSASRGVRTIKSFAIGDKDFSTATIVATLAATWVSGEFFFTIISESYSTGLSFISTVVVGDALGFLLVGLFFAPKMTEFLGKLSIAEAMGDLYGRKIRVITAISGFLAISGLIAVQLKIAGFLFEHILSISPMQGIMLAGFIVTFYSSIGGIKSVTFTDVLQFCTFVIIIPAIAYFLLKTIEAPEVISKTLNTSPLFEYKSIFSFNNTEIYYFLSLFFWFAIPSFYPPIFQRIAMAKDVKQVRTSFIASSAVVFILAIMLSLIGVLMLSLYPNKSGEEVAKLIISNSNLWWVNGFKGLVLAGIMATIMSTVDSYINSSAILLIHDLKESFSNNLIKNELFATRVCSCVIGLISMLFAVRSGNFLEMVIWANIFYIPVVTAPFIISILGFRSTSRSVLAGMIAGFITIIIWENFIKEILYNIEGLVPSMLANLITLFAYHYIFKQEGGWIKKGPSGSLVFS